IERYLSYRKLSSQKLDHLSHLREVNLLSLFSLPIVNKVHLDHRQILIHLILDLHLPCARRMNHAKGSTVPLESKVYVDESWVVILGFKPILKGSIWIQRE